MRRYAVAGGVAVAVLLAAGIAYWRSSGEDRAGPPGPTAAAPSPAPAGLAAAAPAPSFDVVRLTPQGGVVVAGRAAPGAEVTVLDDSKPLGRAAADEHGDWVLLPRDQLASGEHQLSLLARSADGTVARSDSVVALMVPERASSALAAQANESVAVLVPREGAGPATALQLPREVGQRRKLALDVIQYDAGGTVQLLGRAEPEARIDVYVDDKLAGSGAADGSGGWSVTLRQSVPEGKYRLRLEALDGRGRKLAQLGIAFDRVAPPDGTVAVHIQPGNNLWRIAQHSYGDGLRYTEIYQANRTRIHDPNLIYPGQVFAVPATR